jgi:hypothetical protein
MNGLLTAQCWVSKMQSSLLIQNRARKNLLLVPLAAAWWRPASLAAAQKASQERSVMRAMTRRTAWDWVRRRTASRERTGARK